MTNEPPPRGTHTQRHTLHLKLSMQLQSMFIYDIYSNFVNNMFCNVDNSLCMTHPVTCVCLPSPCEREQENNVLCFKHITSV